MYFPQSAQDLVESVRARRARTVASSCPRPVPPRAGGRWSPSSSTSRVPRIPVLSLRRPGSFIVSRPATTNPGWEYRLQRTRTTSSTGWAPSSSRSLDRPVETLIWRSFSAYSPLLVNPMRAELTSVGFEELLTVDDVEQFMQTKGEVPCWSINSVCGCAAGQARPGVRAAVSMLRGPAIWRRSSPARTSTPRPRRALLRRYSTEQPVDRPLQGWRAGLLRAAASHRESLGRGRCAEI